MGKLILTASAFNLTLSASYYSLVKMDTLPTQSTKSVSTGPVLTRSDIPVGWLFDYLVNQNLSPEDACQALGLSDAFHYLNKRELPLNHYLKLFEWAADKLSDPLLGVHVAEAMQPGKLGIFGHLVSNGATLQQSLDFVERYHCIFNTSFAFSFTYNENSARCIYTSPPVSDNSDQQDILLSIAATVNIIRGYSTPEWQPLRCSFSFPEPADTTSYSRYFGKDISFDQPHNGLEFETTLLGNSRADVDPSLLPILLQQADQLFNQISGQISNTRDLTERVRLLILTSLGTETLTTQRAADQLNLSVRSLHRQLGQQDTSFKKLREEVIMKVAKEALLDSDCSITEIAARLNYSETSAFDRIFKRLTGSTPRQYRVKHRPQ